MQEPLSTNNEQVNRVEEIRFNALVESLPGFVFIFDDQFFLRDAFMPESMKLFHGMKELVGMDARLIYSQEVSDLFIENIRGCLDDGQLRELEYPVDLKGLRFFYQARIVPYKDNMVLAMIQDIGDRIRRIDELLEIRKREEANLIKSRFLANMSHEIRTPLNAIVGFSEILASGENIAEKEELIEIIRKNNELLLQLVDDILDISRIDSGHIDINMQKIELNSMLRDIADIYKLKMKPGVELHFHHPPGQIFAYIDPNRIKQVLFNFLSNAIKHTTKGSITLELERNGCDQLMFSVVDTGTGIPEDKLSTIFERFEKLDNFSQGTGLGLSISKSIVESLNGEITATSTLGKGSAFSFTLPHHQTAEEAQVSVQSNSLPESKEDSSANRKKILIIEPNDLDYDPFHSVLGKDYLLQRSYDGMDCSDHFKAETPNLIMINISALTVNGVEVIKQIKNISTNVPVIAFTEHGNYTCQELALKAGCDDIVLKPYTASRLLDAIVAYI